MQCIVRLRRPRNAPAAVRRWTRAVNELEPKWGLGSRPAGDLPAGRQPESCAVRRAEALERTVESDVEAWLAWLKEARATQADEQAMRRLVSVYVAGWTAVALASMAIPIVGVAAAVLSLVLFAGMLALGFVVTQPDRAYSDDRAAEEVRNDWPTLGLPERARLVRIINLSRVAARPLGARLLLSELDEALASEPFAGWLAVSELRDIVQAGCAHLVPFGFEASQRQGTYLFAGHVL